MRDHYCDAYAAYRIKIYMTSRNLSVKFIIHDYITISELAEIITFSYGILHKFMSIEYTAMLFECISVYLSYL